MDLKSTSALPDPMTTSVHAQFIAPLNAFERYVLLFRFGSLQFFLGKHRAIRRIESHPIGTCLRYFSPLKTIRLTKSLNKTARSRHIIKRHSSIPSSFSFFKNVLTVAMPRRRELTHVACIAREGCSNWRIWHVRIPQWQGRLVELVIPSPFVHERSLLVVLVSYVEPWLLF